ncbi:retrovirus-related pol polyprotein from transposon TNT 1-94, partial [Tanacetum coccineum]
TNMFQMSVHDYLKRSVWYLYSGCSRHVTGVKQYLHRYSELGPKVVFGDNSSGNTEGYGSVNYNGITFTRVAYVNGLKHNLISISQLCDPNFKVLFTKTQGTIFNKNNEVVLIAPRRRDVYVIDKTSYNEESNACFFSKESNSVNWLWHKRLSHLNLKNICKDAKQNLVARLPSPTFSKDKTCSACEKGKHHRASFKTKRSFSISKGRSPNISYFYMFDYLVHIHNHKDHLGKFDEKVDDGLFLGYSLVAKSFRVFNIRRQEMEETCHVTFNEDDEAITKSSTKGDEINFNKNRSFLDDEFLVPRSNVSSSSNKDDYFPYVLAYDPLSTNNITISDHVTPTNTPTLQDISSPNESAQF